MLWTWVGVWGMKKSKCMCVCVCVWGGGGGEGMCASPFVHCICPEARATCNKLYTL